MFWIFITATLLSVAILSLFLSGALALAGLWTGVAISLSVCATATIIAKDVSRFVNKLI